MALTRSMSMTQVSGERRILAWGIADTTHPGLPARTARAVAGHLRAVMIEPASSPSARPPRHSAYWRSNLRLTAGLLLLWFLVTFGFGFFAGDLNFSLFGWPFSFWMAAQGALVIYCLIVWAYAWAMDRQDARHRAGGEQRDAL